MSHRLPVTGSLQQASLVRPVTGPEALPDRPFGYCLGSKSEVSALCVGTYGFPGVVYEITLDPRLASRGSNDQSRNRSAPLLSCIALQSTGSSKRRPHQDPTTRWPERHRGRAETVTDRPPGPLPRPLLLDSRLAVVARRRPTRFDRFRHSLLLCVMHSVFSTTARMRTFMYLCRRA
jgi:hypothetical protein